MKYLYCQVVLLVFIKILNVSSKLSGLYVDNGFQQTVMEHSLTDDDKIEVEHELLELLGLPDRPRLPHNHPSLRKSAPKFLLDIYQRLLDVENGNRTTRDADIDNYLSEEDEKAIDQSDTIMTFLNKNHHVAEVRHERGRRLWFDVSEVSNTLTLMMGELRIYQNPSIGKWKDSSKTFTLTAYTIVSAERQKELEVLDMVNTTADYRGWIEFNITNALEKWVFDKESNKGLYISAHAVNNPDHEVKLENIGLVNTKGDDEYQPFMVGFFNGQQIIESHKMTRNKRSTSTTPKKKKKFEKHIMGERKAENNKSCQIQTLYVSFQDLKWHDWIIAPNGFHAYYCSGECNFPLNAPTNPTNHAIVQTLVHLVSPSKVPKPCCVPTKLGPISVLYYLDETNVNLKKYKNMVVKSCGCH